MNKKQILEKKFGYLFIDNPDPLYIRALAHLGAKPVFTYKIGNFEPIVYCGMPYSKVVSSIPFYTPERFETRYFGICTETDLDLFEKYKRSRLESPWNYAYFLPYVLYFK